jgi:hypothetical protein
MTEPVCEKLLRTAGGRREAAPEGAVENTGFTVRLKAYSDTNPTD